MPSIDTVNDLPPRVQYIASAAQTVFPYPFPIFQDADLVVVRDGITAALNVDYTVSGEGDDLGGNVTWIGPAMVGGEINTIYRDIAIERDTDISQNGPWSSATYNDEQDKIFLIMQQLEAANGRTLRVPTTAEVDDAELILDPAQFANTYLSFDADGKPTPAALVAGTLTQGTFNSFLAASYDSTIDRQRADIEIAAGVTPAQYGLEVLRPDRYTSLTEWNNVMAQVSTLPESYHGWYRGDRAIHYTLTNCIVGNGAYNDYATSLLGGTQGYRCSAFGVGALRNNAGSTFAGGSNCAFGFLSQEMSVETSGNCTFGTESGRSMTGIVSAHNNGFGHQTLTGLVTGTQNNAFAYRALFALVTGNNNHFFGESGGFGLQFGSGNHGFGFQNQFSKIAGNFSQSSGFQALFSETQSTITAITKAASAVVTISTGGAINPFQVGAPVTFAGILGMTQIDEAITTVAAIGGSTGAWTVTVPINSTAYSNFTSGYLCPFGNIADGYQAGFQLTRPGGNLIRGAKAVSTGSPGYGNTVDGFEAGLVLAATTTSNAALNNIRGFWAARALTTASSCVVEGQRALFNGTTCDETIAIGPNSAGGTTTALRGVWAGSATGTNLNGNNNTGYGYNAGSVGSPQTYQNTGNFGANAVPNASDRITFGDGSITQLRAQVTTITALSDERYKKNIRKLDIPDEFFEELEIVCYEWDNDKWLLDEFGQIAIDDDGRPFPAGIWVGVIAQKLDALQKKFGLEWLNLVDKSNPNRWEATPGNILFFMTLYVQRKAATIKALDAKFESQQGQIDALSRKFYSLNKQ